MPVMCGLSLLYTASKSSISILAMRGVYVDDMLHFSICFDAVGLATRRASTARLVSPAA